MLDGFDKLLESRIRLGIMAVLAANESYDFVSLRELLGATDGNLTTHLCALEKAGYIDMSKKFIGRKPNTSFSITEKGRDALRAHIESINSINQ